MRIRNIKPEFWRSDDIASLCFFNRLLFIGLWSYVDDNGVGKYHLIDICADLFAADLAGDSTETLRRVSEGLSVLETQKLITLYQQDGQKFLFINNWERHQKVHNPNKPRYPRPSNDSEPLQPAITETLPRVSENLGTGSGGQRVRGSEGQITPPTPSRGGESQPPTELTLIAEDKKPDASEQFAEWYSIYPRKADRQKALKAFRAALKKTSFENLIAGAQRYRDDPNRDPQYTKMPATWLNAGSWENQPLPARGSDTQTIPRSQQNLMQNATTVRNLRAMAEQAKHQEDNYERLLANS